MNRFQPFLAGVLFAFAYTQPLAFYSNQNQYYLHGMAQAGVGNLSSDWLAQTADPTPIFSLGVAVCVRHLGAWPLQVVFFTLVAVFSLAIWTMFDALDLLPKTLTGRWLFAALVTATHAGIFRFASDRMLGADYFWFLQSGLANQYLLGAGLQPSVFGVFLMVALGLYAGNRPVLAAAVAAGTNLFHATYLLPAALLVAGFLAAELWAGNTRTALLLGGVALLIAGPIAGVCAITFGPSQSHTFAAAQDILVNLRLPHHTRPDRWFDGAAGGQLILMVVGLFLFRKTRLFIPLFVAAVMAALLSAVTLLTGNLSLSLLFPWRISAVLVPLSSAIVVTALARAIEPFQYVAGMIAGCLLVGCVAGTLAIYQWKLGYQEPASEDPVLEYLHVNAKPGEVYLIPARFPKPNPPRGVYSNTFTAPPDSTATVYFELARFRLTTGAPLFIDFKSIPYKDTDVLEWHRRVAACVKWFGNPNWTDATIDEIRREGITHVVAPTKLGLKAERLKRIYEAGAYQVFEVGK